MNPEDVVISGIGGSFPKAKTLDIFKEKLYSNEILLGSRWKDGENGVTNKLGTCEDIDKFDTAFFGIHRHQTTYMDPMQRLVLERAFEALVDAGVNPQDIRGKKIAVYTASSIGENDNLFYESIVSGFGVTGHSRAMMANRISYWLDLKGPSCAYDSNWIGGIEVLTLAFDAIKNGHCESALIASANLALNSEISWLFNDMGVLSPDGSTKSFDANATGYARADGFVAMYLQKAKDAHRAYASVVHSATVFNGARDSPMLDLDLGGMTEFLDKFYKDCGVDPGEVEYVETYGCGIKKTDEIELKAIESVYCKNRKKPLLIGALKPQTGHSEASDNLVTIAKAVITLENEQIPATVQHETPNPNIPGFFNGNLEVVTKNTPWKGNLIAVNGVGIASSYAHVLLKANPKRKVVLENDFPKLIVASTRTEAGIQQILKTLQTDPNIDREYIALTHELFSKTVYGHLYRGFTILDQSEVPKQEFEHYPGIKRPVWFIYSGMGSQWSGMGVELMKIPLFAESIMKSHKILEAKGIDLLKIITDTDPKMFDSILHSFVGIAAIQIALTDILKAIGVVPDGILGHSVGELGCSYADECLTAEQMILCSYSRGKASIEAELINGMMAAIGMGYNQIKNQLPPSIEVACHNSKDSCTLSGPTEDMEVYVKDLQNRGVFARLVNVANIAYHSRYIKPAAPRLLEYLKKIIPDPKARSKKWICSSALEEKWDGIEARLCSAEYHTNNLLGSVLFEEGSKHIPKDAICIEIAPHGLLQAILKRSLPSGCTNIPLTQRGNKNGVQFLLSAIGKMYLAGIDVNLSPLYPHVEFPVSRGTGNLSSIIQWEHSETWRIGIEDKMNYLVSIKDVQVMLNSEDYRYCSGHELDENCVFPFTGYLDLVLEILCYGLTSLPPEVVFENIQFKNFLIVPRIGSVPLHAMVQKGSGNFEILSGETVILCGRMYIPQSTDKPRVAELEIEMGETLELTGKDVYSEFAHRGHKYLSDFKSIKSITIGKTGQMSKIGWISKWQMLLEALLQQAYFKGGEKRQHALTPSFIQKIVVNFDKLPTENEDVNVSYDYYTEVISCDCMQVIGLQHEELTESPRKIHIHNLDFSHFANNVADNIEVAINNSIHLVIDNFDEPDVKNIIISDIETTQKSFADSIKNILDKNIDINCNFNTTKENKVAIMSSKQPILITCNDIPTDNILNIISSTHAFGFVRTTDKIRNKSQVVQVIEFQVEGVSYSLIKRASNINPEIVQIKTDVLSIKDLSKDNLSWTQDLKSKVTTGKKTLLVCPVVPIEGIINFVNALRSMLDFRNVRCLFTLDKKIDLNLNSAWLKNIFKQDLYISVLKNGSSGTYIPTPIELTKNLQRNVPSSSSLLSTKHLQYIGINVDDETLTQEKHDVGLGNIDYAGVDAKGENIVGLANLDPDTCDFIPDPVLHWKIPEIWSLEDGCTIPHAYTTAYYILVVKGRVAAGETLLIHDGCSGIGYALIAIAAAYGCTVFTTVATNEQKLFLKQQFPKLLLRNILSNQNSSFETDLLMATGGEGAHIIVNTVSKSLLNASVRCLADTGRFIQLGKFDVKEHHSIGMSVFLRNTSFGTVIPENIFELPVEDKERLRDLVQDGIDKFFIRPIMRKVLKKAALNDVFDTLVDKANIGKILVEVTPDLCVNYLNAKKPNQFICDVKSSYIIYGGTSEIWTDLVEWLVFRGARKIIVIAETKAQQLHLNRRLALLRNYYNTEILYIQNKIQTKENASEFLSEVYRIGPISAIFILPTKSATQSKQSEIKPVQYLDMALRNISPKALFVNFFGDALGIGQNRADAEFPTYNVESSIEFSEILYGLDDVLTLKAKHLLIKSGKLGDLLHETTQVLQKKLTLMLPSTPEDLLSQYKSAPQNPRFKQVLTLGPRRIREVPPIFVIPGLFNFNDIADMCEPFLHPTFVAELPNNTTSLPDVAKQLAEEIISIFPNGPYNVVGVSWGGALSIEVARIVQKKAATQLTLVDGSPDSINAAITSLGDPVNIEVNVISNLLNITTTATLTLMNNASDLNARLDIALESWKDTPENKKSLKDSLNLLMHRLMCLTSYKSSDEVLTGDVFLIRPSGASQYDECGLSKYSSRNPRVRVVNGDHLSMLQTEELEDIVNDNIVIR